VATERRARKSRGKASGAAKPARSQDDNTIILSAGGSVSPASVGPVIIPALSQSPEQHASCYFMSNFVLVPRRGNGRGYMDYLVPLLKTESPSSTFVHAFQACAFASMGNRVLSNGIDLNERGLSEYTKALAATHVALKDPELSKADGTLAAVLLLGFFEVGCCSIPSES